MNVEVNYWVVLLAATSSMFVGSIWYSKRVFGRAWAKLAKIDLDKKISNSQMFLLMGSTFVASLLTAYVLAYVTFLSNRFFGNSFLEDSLMTALWLWLGFTAARIYTHNAFEQRRKKLTLLAVSHELVTLMVMALIIGLFGI
ncbi:MAG: DUF1761 domain-containing protein [bacterium]|nr:DUF1761 domain-containing protein [bacterium]